MDEFNYYKLRKAFMEDRGIDDKEQVDRFLSVPLHLKMVQRIDGKQED